MQIVYFIQWPTYKQNKYTFRKLKIKWVKKCAGFKNQYTQSICYQMFKHMNANSAWKKPIYIMSIFML